MKRKMVIAGMMVLTWAAVFALMGCPNPDGPGEQDTWTKVSNVNEIMGTWEGSTTVPVQMQEGAPVSSVGIDVHMTIDEETLKGAITIDMDKYLTDMAGLFGKAAMWDLITQNIPEEAEEGFTIKPTADYKMIMTGEVPIRELDFSGANAENAPYINQDKTKLKVVIPAAMSPAGKDIEMILVKQQQ